MKQAKIDFLDGRNAGNSRQIRDSFKGVQGIVEPPPYLDFAKLLELYQSSEVYYRAVQIKAQYTTGLGWKLIWEDNGEKSTCASEEKKRNNDVKVVRDFFRGCNASMSFEEILHQLMVDFECLGNGYLEVTRDTFGNLSGLYHVPAHTVRILSDGGFIQVRGTKKRKFLEFGAEPANDSDGIPLSEMIHFAKYNPHSSYYGMPDSVPAIGATMGDILARDYNIEFFDNNAAPQYCLIVSGGVLSQKDREDLQNYMAALKGNPHKTMVLQFPQGVTGELKPISTSPKESSFIEYRQMNRDLMVIAHGVPPHLLGIIETGNIGGGTGESQLANFKHLVISPRQKFLGERITRQLIAQGMGIKGLRFEFNELDAEDELAKAQVDKILIEAGVLKPDEVRARMGMR